MCHIKQKLQQKKGFTLIELIVVIAILVILAAIALPQYSNLQDSSKETVCAANRKSLMQQVLYEASLHGITDDTDLTEIVEQYTCPAGGILSASYRNETIAIYCSKHKGTAIELASIDANISALVDKVNEIYKSYNHYNGLGKNMSYDSTGPNFTAIKEAFSTEVLGLDPDNDDYDLQVYNAGDGTYKVYLFESLTGHSKGDSIPVTGYILNADGSVTPGTTQSVTLTSKTVNDRNEQPCTFLVVDTGNNKYKW